MNGQHLLTSVEKLTPKSNPLVRFNTGLVVILQPKLYHQALPNRHYAVQCADNLEGIDHRTEKLTFSMTNTEDIHF